MYSILVCGFEHTGCVGQTNQGAWTKTKQNFDNDDMISWRFTEADPLQSIDGGVSSEGLDGGAKVYRTLWVCVWKVPWMSLSLSLQVCLTIITP